MKKIFLSLIAILSLNIASAQTVIFNEVLQKHVDIKGNVDYKNFDSKKLNTFISYLEETTPDKSWSSNKQKAFWINAYNAYTLKIILDNYPLQSILEIKRKGKAAWKIPFAKIGGKTYTLDHIEHNILRKNFTDPKIHVGVNCASDSCPKLSNIAFTEDNVNKELERLMKVFINDASKNKLSKKNVQISSIFDWFQEDFTMDSTLIGFLNKYSDTAIKPDAQISYLKYNWTLNSK
jgi:hypothetical protein